VHDTRRARSEELPVTGDAVVLKCAGCARKPPPHACQGRPPCCCVICHGADIVADARRRQDTSNGTAMLRDSVRELLALRSQRLALAERIRLAEPRIHRCEACGALIASQRHGRHRRTCSGACRTRLWRKRKRELATLAKSHGGGELFAPPGFDPASKRWQPGAFERWWAGQA
jgi:hypothetical protein